jgi:hypothetical protein
MHCQVHPLIYSIYVLIEIMLCSEGSELSRLRRCGPHACRFRVRVGAHKLKFTKMAYCERSMVTKVAINDILQLQSR